MPSEERACPSCGRYRNGGPCGIDLEQCLRTAERPYWIRRQKILCATSCYQRSCDRPDLCHYFGAKNWVTEFTLIGKLEDVIAILAEPREK